MADSLVLDIPDGVYGEVPGWSGMIRHPDILAMTAGVYPVLPPSKWFDNPSLPRLTPLTIDDDGRVFGHIAAWHTSHIGMAGGVKPPRSKSNYAYYRTGVVKCDDGKFVDVGQITLTGGHAPLNAGVSRAVAHYDDTASAIMDVAAGEDKHGIWVAGALRPDVTDSQLRSIRASSVSGDWRPINGKLELVAVCAVNAPGFPIPRARVASGAPIALVAAGIEPLVEIAMNDRLEANIEEGIKAGLELFRERILRLENVVLADGGVMLEDEDKPPATIPEAVDADKLRKRVRGGSALAASLRDRVRGPQVVVNQTIINNDVVEDVQALAASLRERVKGSGGGDPKAPAPEALTAARKRNFNPLLHPRGADGKFIEKDSWVRWLRPGFGSTRRGKVLEIIPDPNNPDTKVLARVEFPDRDGKTVVHDVQFDELEKVAPPKGALDGDPSIVLEAVELSEEDLEELGEEDITPAVDGVSDWTETSEWAAALRKVREQFEEWRASKRESDPDVNVTIEEYLDWVESRGLDASLVAGLRAKTRVHGLDTLVARATEDWTEESREKASNKGHALPDGSYPIADAEDLRKAIQAFGRAKNKEAAKRHITKRARQLKKTDMLPEGWTASGFQPTMPTGKSTEEGSDSEVDRLRGRVHGAA